MKNQLIKPILIGIVAGAALFFMPFFLLRGLLFVLLIFGLFRLFTGWRFRRWGYHSGFHPAMADTIRSMSDEEYQTFRQKFESYSGRYRQENPKKENS